jgi:hypothetical protein
VKGVTPLVGRLLKNQEADFMHDPSLFIPQTVNLGKDAAFQNIIIDVIPSENMI